MSDPDQTGEAAAGGPPLRLELTGPGGDPTRVTAVGPTVVVGRGADCGVRLDHAMVSRRHARLDRSADGHWHVTDLQSHNGTRVNDAPVADVALAVGDRVGIGPFTLRLDPPPNWASTLAAPAGRDDRLSVSDDGRVIRTLGEVQPPRLAVDQLRCLEDFGRAVLETPEPADRLTALCRLMLNPCFGGRWAVAVATPVGDDPRPLCPVQRAGGADQEPTRLSRSLLRAAHARGEPVIATNRPGGDPGDDGFELSIAADVSVMAAVAVPLDPARGTAGLLYATFPPEYGTGEWLALCALAVRHHRQAEVVWANIAANRKLAALEADVERARRVQDRLVPKRSVLPGLDVAVRFRPCHGVAGDYVDAVPLPDGRSLLVMADVSGKGLPAALVAMGLHTIVHAAARQWGRRGGGGLADLAAALDAHLVESLPPEAFVTLLAMAVDPATGAVEAVNAGHPPAVAFAPGTCRDVPADGDLMLGPFPQTLALQPDRLADGETMLLFTDGCFELFDAAGHMLGPAELCRQAAGRIVAAPDAATAADAVVALLDRWQGDGQASDDRTLLLVRRRSSIA